MYITFHWPQKQDILARKDKFVGSEIVNIYITVYLFWCLLHNMIN